MAAHQKLDRQRLPWGVTHSDLHAHNVTVRPDNSVTLMDFDGCGEDFLAQELAVLTWAGRKKKFPEPAIQAFLAGYDSERPRTDEDARSSRCSWQPRKCACYAGFPPT